MALTATIYNFDVELADNDRGVYESLDLRVAMHPSESPDYLATRVLELSRGKFYSYEGNYTDYLLARAERQAVEEMQEHKRQKFLKRELAWVRMVAALAAGLIGVSLVLVFFVAPNTTIRSTRFRIIGSTPA